MKLLFYPLGFCAGIVAHMVYRKAKYGKLDRGLEKIYRAVKELDRPRRNWETIWEVQPSKS